MKTEEKLEQIVDRLIIKTQDNLCEWKLLPNSKKFRLCLNFGEIHVYQIIPNEIGIDFIANNIVITNLIKSTEIDSNVLKLYNTIYSYHQNYIDMYIDKFIQEVQKLGD